MVVLETREDEEEIHQGRGRNALQVIRRKDQRTILTLFGIGFRKKRRIEPLPEILVLERATDCSYRKAGKEILPQNQELCRLL